MRDYRKNSKKTSTFNKNYAGYSIKDFAISKGVKVILTTSCEEGEVFPVYDFTGGVKDLQERGVIIGRDLDSKKARIKLFVLLSAGITDVESIQKSFLE